MGAEKGEPGVLLAEFLRRHAAHYAAGVAALMAVDLLQLAIPRVLGSVADLYAAGQLDRGAVLVAGARLIGLAILIGVGRWAWRHFLLGASRELEAELRERLFAHLQRMSPAYFQRHRVGDLMAHLTNDVQAVRMAAGQGVVMLVDAVFMTAAVVTVMAWHVDPRLMALAAAPLALGAMALTLVARQVYRRSRSVQEGFSHLSEFVEENLTGIRVVKGFGREADQEGRFFQLAQQQARRQVELARVQAAVGPIGEGGIGIAFAAVLGVGGWLVLEGAIRLGDFVAFSSYVGLLAWPVTSVGWLVNMVQRGRASLQRLQAILETPPDSVDAPDARPLPRLAGRIEVRHLSFTYPGADRPSLVDVSFTVEPGEVIGIAGTSGSGKSTLAWLLLRLHEPPEGTIFVDGCDVRQVRLADLRRQVGFVPQEPFLFSVTLAENIAFGSEALDGRAPDGRVEQVSRLAHLHEDVTAFPDGYASRVGERGLALSGGQKQRAAIARALIREPRIFILDDALSGVDAATEQAILEDLMAALEGRTAILISHRVSVVRRAHRILVLHQGRLVEQGTHEQLVAAGGLYARMFHRQRLEEDLMAS